MLAFSIQFKKYFFQIARHIVCIRFGRYSNQLDRNKTVANMWQKVKQSLKSCSFILGLFILLWMLTTDPGHIITCIQHFPLPTAHTGAILELWMTSSNDMHISQRLELYSALSLDVS